GEPKDPDSSSLATLYQAFASDAETAAFRAALSEGLGWGEAKQRLAERIERDLAPLRAKYDALIAKPAEIEELLQSGAKKARAIAAPLLAELRAAVGLRAFVAVPAAGTTPVERARAALPQFKQYREDDGRFYFKLLDGEGNLLLQSAGFASPKDAGQRIAGLRRDGFDAPDAQLQLGPEADAAAVGAALAALAAADAGKQRAKA